MDAFSGARAPREGAAGRIAAAGRWGLVAQFPAPLEGRSPSWRSLFSYVPGTNAHNPCATRLRACARALRSRKVTLI
ncbi:hypothetical protein C6Y14_08310 [Streptomyces dioscori]|uniref:Uncharacterized protein n=1 Tax=Streptomyces dioscori TaxID=2109333 RepID=A0A2P8QBJ6_9ACTN|nr:hypothetical protein C6Y14_08310 [Streptomyces dioscori]